MPHAICVIANEKSGGNVNDRNAIDAAISVFGDGTTYRTWSPDGNLEALITRSIRDGADIIVAAGGDGTVMAVANVMTGRDIPMAVLPLGTFNFFARGLGLSEDPAEAARQILDGRAHDIRVGEVNGQVFLNNASLGIYPSILRERETVYRRWGRRRIAAHWSVVKTLLRFRRPLHLTLDIDGKRKDMTTAMVFVARSAYQLEFFRLGGADLISEDRFAVLVAHARDRLHLFQLTWRLATGRAKEGREYDLFSATRLTVTTRRDRTIVAYDGEKSMTRGPFAFRMSKDPLKIILPTDHDSA